MNIYCPKCGEISGTDIDTISPDVTFADCINCGAQWRIEIEFTEVED